MKQKIFMSEDYILSFRTRDGSLSLWRAEDIGNEYVPLTLEIPEKYTYDYYEVVGCAGGGGSGEETVTPPESFSPVKRLVQLPAGR